MCGSMRMIVVGDGSPDKGFTKGSYTFSLIGELSPAAENKIKFLKTAALLSKLDDKEVTYEHLLAAVQKLHNEVSATFSKGMPEVTMRKSCAVDKAKLDKHQIDVVCEHPTLSMRAAGMPYLIIDRKNIKEDVSVINEKYLDFLLDSAAAAYDVDGLWPTLGEGGRKIYWSIVGSEGFKAGRVAIRTRL